MVLSQTSSWTTTLIRLLELGLPDNRPKARPSLIKGLSLACPFRRRSENQRPHLGELGTGVRQTECASRAADQSGQALSGYSRKARHNLVADYSADQSVVVIDTHTDLE